MKTAYSPLRIEILLHYNISTKPVPNIDAPAVVQEVKNLVSEGALEVIDSAWDLNGKTHAATPLGKAWVQALCNVPIPRQVFVDEQGRIL